MDVHKVKCFWQERVAAWILLIRAESGEHTAESFGFGNPGEIQHSWNCSKGVGHG